MLATNLVYQVLVYQINFILFKSLSFSLDPYCIISFDRYSQTTRYVPESLCPTWDETRIFDGIRMFGSPKVFQECPPKIIIELFDKDTVVHIIYMYINLSLLFLISYMLLNPCTCILSCTVHVHA